ncbi:hypothetical protein [Dyadobacter tibetensis]|uniref:hypothetical protein n=1 Tax=Dyadobacter tibetensis TaxID=1211851 RepID=UPI000472F0A4|nr:hypothetical protein [Dyadobacter tibetensis]
MLFIYAPATSSDLIIFLIMLLGAFLLAFAAGYFTHTPYVTALEHTESKLQHELGHLQSQSESSRDSSPPKTGRASSPLATAAEKIPDDLTKIHGISAEMQQKLASHGIYTYRQLQLYNPLHLKQQIGHEGEEILVEDIIVWQQQAGLAAAHRWDELATLQEEIDRTKNI